VRAARERDREREREREGANNMLRSFSGFSGVCNLRSEEWGGEESSRGPISRYF